MPAESQGTERGVAPYAIGGARDVRLRAVAGVTQIERVLETVNRELRAVPRIGRLKLRYHRRNNYFEWRWREARRRSTVAGYRFSQEQLAVLRQSTRTKVEAVQRVLDVRTAAIGVLRLIEWALDTGENWQEQTVTLRWSCGERRRAVWGFLLSGGIVRRGNVNPLDGVESGYSAEVKRLSVSVAPEGWRGEVTGAVRYAVEELCRIDDQLKGLQGSLRAWLRMYYNVGTDTWTVRQLFGPKRSRYVADEACERLMGKLIEQEREILDKAVATMRRRRRLKRLLHVVAGIGEAAQHWPGGTWQLRGEGNGEVSAVWVATALKRGMSMIREGVVVGHGKSR